MMQRFLSLFIPRDANLADPRVRTRVALVEGWTAVAVNTALAAFKGALGFATGSIALLADAANNLSDLLISAVVIFGFRASQKPADREHPFGHGRMESIAGMVIGVLFAVVAFEAFKAGLDRLLHPRPMHAPDWLILTLIGTMGVKALLSEFARRLGDMIQSDTLRADAWNHRADVFATAMVVAAFIAVHWDWWWVDGVMGMAVSVFIAWAAWKTMRGASGPLLGEHAPEAMYEEIERIALAVPGVRGVHDILVNRYGALSIISLHIEVSADESALHLHQMSDDIEARIADCYGGHAIVHIDPLNTSHEHYEQVQRVVSQALAAEAGVLSFHDLRLVGEGRHFKVVFDVALKPGSHGVSAPDLADKVRERLIGEFPHVKVVVELEPPYFRNV